MTSPEISDALQRALASARALGFLGPGPLDDHVESARGFLVVLEGASADDPALDLGSGGGVPGLLLASWLPTWSWTLLDAQRRRTSFLTRTTVTLDFGERVRVLRGRTEDLAHDPSYRGMYGCITARSFGPPAATAEAAAGFLRLGGCLVVSEPPDGKERWDHEGLSSLGLGVEALIETRGRRFALLRAVAACPSAVPRPMSQQRARPAW